MIARLAGPGFGLWLEGDETAVRRVSFSAIDGPEGSLDWITASLTAYLQGQYRESFPGGLAFGPQGPLWVREPTALEPTSPLQHIYRALAALTYGQTLTYGELGALAGNPRWARAAGQACRLNQLPVLVPCHRVLAAHSLGGFGPGLELKRRLLALEGLNH
jgi:O-6-methylguanine DNA methyltransferase